MELLLLQTLYTRCEIAILLLITNYLKQLHSFCRYLLSTYCRFAIMLDASGTLWCGRDRQMPLKTHAPSSSVEESLGSGCLARSYTSQTPLHLRWGHMSSFYDQNMFASDLCHFQVKVITSGCLLRPLSPLLEAEDSELLKTVEPQYGKSLGPWITMWREAAHQPDKNKEDLTMQREKERQREKHVEGAPSRKVHMWGT